jgi:predicted nucleotidyltransferase
MINHSLQLSLQNYFSGQPVLRAFIFGSYVRNEEKESSDIDILVEFDPKVPVGMEYVQIYLDLKKITGKEVDLVTEKSLSKYVKPYVDDEKVMIYERKA